MRAGCLPGDVTYLFTCMLNKFILLQLPFSTGPGLVKKKNMQTNVLFWECLAEDISLGICEHSLFGVTAPANLLF